MPSPFPIRRDTSPTVDDVLVLEPTDARSESVLQSVSSETALEVLDAISRDPTPASEIADDVGTSIQNVEYHLGNLKEAGLVSCVDVWYSETGTEMDVYAPTQKAVVLLTGPDEKTIPVREAVTSAGVALLVVALLSRVIAAWTTNPFRGYQGVVEIDPGMLAYLRPGVVFLAGGIAALATTAALLVVFELRNRTA